MLKLLVAAFLQCEFDGLQITAGELFATIAISANYVMMMVMSVVDGGDLEHRVVIGQIHAMNDLQAL